MLATVQNASEKMKRLLSQLRVGATPVEQPVALDVAEVVRDAVAGKCAPNLSPAVEVDHAQIRTIAHRERLERVVGHLIQNATEATRNGGDIRVRVKGNCESAIIEVEDTGVGMTPEFVHTRLFRPFESTKQNGMGIGIYESREYVRELGGRLDVQSREHVGTCFRIELPLFKPENNSRVACER
jgi:putative PEP-CTERM system histidine kinase